MSQLRSIDFTLLGTIFGMEGGYVLNFSDASMSRFFANDLNIDIDDARYRTEGNSKAKRLRCFLRKSDDATVLRVLKELWQYRASLLENGYQLDTPPSAQGRFLELLDRLGGKQATSPASGGIAPAAAFLQRERFFMLRDELLALAQLAPHPRGYAFEKFLNTLFAAFDLAPREAFRVRGEQIDGSFLLSNETYLLEAKWENAFTGAAQLHAFHGKIEQKSQWARGLFISNSGFSEDGIHAFGRAKRIILMEGLDLFDALNREIPLPHVLAAKERRAAESGVPFVRVRELFP